MKIAYADREYIWRLFCISSFQKIIDEVEYEQRTTRTKYDGLKNILIARNRTIQFLEAKCVEQQKKTAVRLPNQSDLVW